MRTKHGVKIFVLFEKARKSKENHRKFRKKGIFLGK